MLWWVTRSDAESMSGYFIDSQASVCVVAPSRRRYGLGERVALGDSSGELTSLDGDMDRDADAGGRNVGLFDCGMESVGVLDVEVVAGWPLGVCGSVCCWLGALRGLTGCQ